MLPVLATRVETILSANVDHKFNCFSGKKMHKKAGAHFNRNNFIIPSKEHKFMEIK